MKLAEISIHNFRGIDKLENLNVSNLNTFVGKNDSGKSVILRALERFFDEKKFDQKDVYKGKPDTESTYIELSFDPSLEIDDLALDSKQLITIKKEFDCASGKLKVTSFYKCKDFSEEKYFDLWNKKEEDLNKLIMELGITPERSGRGKKNVIRIQQIKKALVSFEREDIYHPLGEFLKNIENTYENISFPEFSLFDAEQDLSIESTNFQSRFKPIISAYFESTKTETEGIEEGLTKNLAIEFEEIRKFMAKNVRGLKKFTPVTEFDWTKSLKKFDLNLEFEGNDFDVPISHKGTGFKRLLMVAYFEYLASKNDTKDQIFAIEEPETFLHPSAQEDLLNSIVKISELSQFFITTHSPVFAGATNSENSILVTKDEHGVSHYEKGTEDIIHKIISELGIRPDYNLLKRSKFLVFLEGNDDVLFLQNAAKTILGKNLKEDGIACVIGGGSSLSNSADLDLFKDINGSKYAVLVDGDIGNEQKQKEKEFIEARCIEDKAIFHKLTKNEIENYCPLSRIKECCITEIQTKEGSTSRNPLIAHIESLNFSISEDADVDTLLKKYGIFGFKNGKNIKVFEMMDLEDWNRVDSINEIKEFIESIYSAI